MSNSAKIVIYSSEPCPYCVRAKQYFSENGFDYNEIRIDLDAEKRSEMMQRTGRRTVPQIFINEQHIGGCDDLMALVASGEIKKLLG